MNTPLQIIFHHLAHSDAIEARIREKVKRLEKFFPRIISVRVVVEQAFKRHHQGNLYQVRIDLAVPGEEIIVDRSSRHDPAHEDVYVAIRDSFRAARRQLEDYVRINFRPPKRRAQESSSTL